MSLSLTMAMKKIKVYVDTNIISGMAKQDFSDEIMHCLNDILELRKQGKIELYLSEVTSEEIERIPEEYRYYHNLIYTLINNVALKPKSYSNLALSIATRGLTGGSIGIATKGLFPAQQKDPLFVEIERIIPQKNNTADQKSRLKDIEHLFQCKKNNLDIFWTEDKKTILKYASGLRKIGITVMGSL
ncbi:unnamed protein product, partial [marine sediment metagenome]